MADESDMTDPTDEEVNPIVELFREKCEEYWLHIKETIKFAFDRRIERAKEIGVPGEPTEKLIKEINEDKIEMFEKEVKRVEDMFLEGISRLEDL